MLRKEKGSPERGEPIPNAAPGQGSTESTSASLNLQVSALARRCAVSAAMAAILAPLIYGEVSP